MKLSLACTPIILGLLSPLLIPRCQSNRSNAVQLFLQHRCNYTTGLDRLPMFSVFVITRANVIALFHVVPTNRRRFVKSTHRRRKNSAKPLSRETKRTIGPSNCCLTREYGIVIRGAWSRQKSELTKRVNTWRREKESEKIGESLLGWPVSSCRFFILQINNTNFIP